MADTQTSTFGAYDPLAKLRYEPRRGRIIEDRLSSLKESELVTMAPEGEMIYLGQPFEELSHAVHVPRVGIERLHLQRVFAPSRW